MKFRISEDCTVERLGFGTMRLTGRGIWGPPADPQAALATLRLARDLGIKLIDTADSYGPFVSEDLIREALHPYQNQMIATKGGHLRQGPDIWVIHGRPEYLRQCVLMSMRRLKVEQITLWQLHRIDRSVPRDEQFGVMAEMQKEGLIRHLGLSEVSIDDIEAASTHFRIATVQNEFNLVTRKSEDVLDYCAARGIGFIPWYPLAEGHLAKPGGLLTNIAKKIGATPSQVTLAWLLKRSPVMLPIPGTSRPDHLKENMKAASLDLPPADFEALSNLRRS